MSAHDMTNALRIWIGNNSFDARPEDCQYRQVVDVEELLSQIEELEEE
ncbi:MAG: hypothetical protein WC365_01215 [Candidatus Babeliales bacterium]|jgi:hypothetical protein